MNFRWFNSLFLVVAFFVGQANLCSGPSDEELRANVDEKINTMDTMIRNNFSVLTPDGQIYSRTCNENFFAGMLSREAFSAQGSTDELPYEILDELRLMLKSDSLIIPDALSGVFERMGQWLLSEKTRLGDFVFCTKEGMSGGEDQYPVQYPRLSAMKVLEIIINSFVRIALMQWHIHKPGEAAFLEIKESLKRFLFSFYKYCYFPTIDAFYSIHGEDSVRKYSEHYSAALLTEVQSSLERAFALVCSDAGIDAHSLLLPPEAPQAKTVHEGHKPCMTDEELFHCIEETLSTIDSLVRSQASQLSTLGKRAILNSTLKILLNLLNPENFEKYGDCEEVRLIPNELFKEMCVMLEGNQLIDITSLELFINRMTAWLKIQQESIPADVFAMKAYGDVQYPRLTAAIVVRIAVITFVGGILSSLYCQEVPEGLVARIKDRLLIVLINFEAGFYHPISEFFIARYGQHSIMRFEIKLTHDLRATINCVSQEHVAEFCEEQSLSGPELLLSRAVSESGSGSSDAPPRRVPCYFVLDSTLDKQGQKKQLMNYCCERLIAVSNDISETSLQNAFTFLAQLSSNPDNTHITLEGASCDLIGSHARSLLNRVQDSSDSVSLEDIKSALQARKDSFETALKFIPDYVYYGVAEQEKFTYQQQFFLNAQYSNLIFYFSMTSVLRKMKSKGQSVDTALLLEIVESAYEEICAYAEELSKIHGTEGTMLVEHIKSQFNCELKKRCPEYFL